MKKIIAWLSLLTIVLTLLMPSVEVTSASNREQRIIDTDELQLTVTPTRSNQEIVWTVDYRKEGTENQRLKLRLTSEGEEVRVLKKRHWEQKEDWFTELNATHSSAGSLSLVTKEDIPELRLEVQIDTEESMDVLSVDLQGPYELDLPIIEEQREKEEDSKKMILESTETSELGNDEGNITQLSEALDPPKHQQVNRFERLLSGTERQGTLPYTDPFVYSHTKEGVFPEVWTNKYLTGSTINTNQENTTRNFDYGKAYQGPPTTTNIIGGNANLLNGYHEHPRPGTTSEKSSVLTKKVVKPTTNPNQFDVSVDVIAGASEVAKPVDVVFVIDKSGSMANDINGTNVGFSSYNSRWQMTKRALNKLSKGLLAPGNDVRLSAVSFGSDWNNKNTAVWAEHSNFNNTPFTNDATTFMNNTIITTNPTTSGTPTYMGVELGTKILQEKARPEAEKFLIVLTDGMATFYPNNTNPKGISQSTVTSQSGKTTYKLTSGNFLGNGTESSDNPKNSYDNTIVYLNNRIYNNRYYPNVGSFHKYSIGLGASGPYIPGTLSAIGPDGQFDAQSEVDLNKAIETISRVIRGYEDVFALGTTTDPMSQYVDLVDDVSTIRFDALTLKKGTPNSLDIIGQGTPNFPLYAQMIQSNAKVEDNTIKLSEMNLSGTSLERFGIRFTYKVELKEEYRDGSFYPANGPTSAKAFNYGESVGFAVPSVRADVFDIPVKKEWEDEGNRWGKRQDITLQLESRSGSGDWEKVKGKEVTLPADATGQELEHVFNRLAKKGPSGQMIHYRVIETSDGNQRVLGYHTPSYDKEQVTGETANKTITIRNELMTTPIELTKINGGKAKLEGVVFTLSSDQETDMIQEVISDKEGKVKFHPLPIGKYVIREKASLAGYEPIKPIQLEIKQNIATGELEVIGLPKDNDIVNYIKEFELNLIKVDQDNQPVMGVVFELTNTADGTKVTAEGNELQGNKFTFTSLKPGTYRLKETVTPENYVGLKEPITLVISESGKVAVDGKEDTATVVLGEKNTIELTVTNSVKGLLPATGGTGTRIYLVTAMVLGALLAIVGAYYVYRHHRGGRVK